MRKISKDMIIADLVTIDPNIVVILMRAGMHCIGCPSAQGETLEEATMVHGLDVDLLVDQINDYLAHKKIRVRKTKTAGEFRCPAVRFFSVIAYQ